MALQVSYEGEGHFILDVLFGALAVNNLTLRLYTNDVTPGNSHTNASFTEADTDWGYAAAALSRGSWTINAGSGATKTNCTYAEQTFTFATYSGTADYVYGYYLTFADGATQRLFGAEKFESRILLATDLTLKITPKIELSDLS